MKFINNYKKFMYGRYGIDELHEFMFKVYLVLFILNIFIKSSLISFIELILIIIIFYRLLSKNINARRKENKWFLNLKNKSKYKDGYIYKKCPKCKKQLKLPIPYKKGIKSVICPKCKKKFSMLVLKSEKVEIISNKK